MATWPGGNMQTVRKVPGTQDLSHGDLEPFLALSAHVILTSSGAIGSSRLAEARARSLAAGRRAGAFRPPSTQPLTDGSRMYCLGMFAGPRLRQVAVVAADRESVTRQFQEASGWRFSSYQIWRRRDGASPPRASGSSGRSTLPTSRARTCIPKTCPARSCRLIPPIRLSRGAGPVLNGPGELRLMLPTASTAAACPDSRGEGITEVRHTGERALPPVQIAGVRFVSDRTVPGGESA
jgi:hypothetical protein